MIVNKTKLGFSIINHESHGLLAGKIALQIADTFRPQHFFESLIAITEHDDRQLDFDEKDYLSENGIPLDFTEASTNINEIVQRMKRVIKESSNKSGWIRLLVSYHLEFLYSNLADESKKIKRFFNREKEERILILEVYKSTEKSARKDYEVLRFCDRLSLILCKDEVPTGGRKLEINKSVDNQTFYISENANEELIIQPWIFKSESFDLAIEERRLNSTYFSSSINFQEELNDVKVKIKTWKLSNLL